jgi:hypothetical protein
MDVNDVDRHEGKEMTHFYWMVLSHSDNFEGIS